MSQIENETRHGSLPLVLGVTGHRDLRAEDVPQLKEKAEELLRQFKRDRPHTPLVVLTSLAEGADHLVARVALELGIRVIVPLPMPRDIYEMDFSTSTSKADFAELLAQAQPSFELPLLPGVTEDQIKDDGIARDRHYEQAGAYIVRHSHLLIALWDGTSKNSVGGTSRVVRFQLEGVPPRYATVSSPIDTPESGPVYQIVTPRVSNPHPQEPFTQRRLFPKGYVGEAARFDRICGRIDTFNRDMIDQGSRLAPEIEKSRKDLLPEAEAGSLHPSLQSLREEFGVADALARYFQHLTLSTLTWLFMLVFLLAVLFDLYAHVFSESHWILGAYLITMAVAYLWINRRAKRRDYQNKYQDYRALAEGTRVQFFVRLAGLEISVADHYLRKQRSELDWICSAIRVWNIPTETTSMPSAENPGANTGKHFDLILEHWVKDQSDFFVEKAKRDHDKLKRYEPYVKALLRIGICVTVLVALALLFNHQLGEWINEHHEWHGRLLVLMSLPPIAAALLHGYLEKRALFEHAKQYSRMSVMFNNARERLTEMLSEGEYEQARDLIKVLGKEALEESGDWVLLHRERPLEVPRG